MNVVISNEKSDKISSLDIDIIKSINGIYETDELISMFKSFFYSRMILDITSLKLFEDINTYNKIASELDSGKIILYLKEGSAVCTNNFLSKLIDLGFYNFTTNVDGIKYLLNKPNSLEDVKKIKQVQATSAVETTGAVSAVSSTMTSFVEQARIIGFKNVTESAGSTTLIYSLKKQLELFVGKKVVCFEINKKDFVYFNDVNMFSVTKENILSEINKYKDHIILVDLNDCGDDSFCGDVFYLLEPSIIKVNKFLKFHVSTLNNLADKRVILNKSLLSVKDVSIFEKEIGFNFTYVLPPINDRDRNENLNNFLIKLGILKDNNGDNHQTGGLFGFFK